MNETSFNIGNGGTYDAISVANIDEDDNPEIVKIKNLKFMEIYL